MERTAKHAPFGDRPGLFRRLMGRRPPDPVTREQAFPQFVDPTDGPEDVVLARVERLERGMHLMAEAMKSTYGRLEAAVEDARQQAIRGTVSGRLHRLRGKGTTERIGVDPLLAEAPVVPGGGDALMPDALTALRRARFAEPEAEIA